MQVFENLMSNGGSKGWIISSRVVIMGEHRNIWRIHVKHGSLVFLTPTIFISIITQVLLPIKTIAIIYNQLFSH